jgi:hypothetical protein
LKKAQFVVNETIFFINGHGGKDLLFTENVSLTDEEKEVKISGL